MNANMRHASVQSNSCRRSRRIRSRTSRIRHRHHRHVRLTPSVRRRPVIRDQAAGSVAPSVHRTSTREPRPSRKAGRADSRRLPPGPPAPQLRSHPRRTGLAIGKTSSHTMISRRPGLGSTCGVLVDEQNPELRSAGRPVLRLVICTLFCQPLLIL